MKRKISILIDVTKIMSTSVPECIHGMNKCKLPANVNSRDPSTSNKLVNY